MTRAARALRLHAALAIVVPGCLAAGGFELSRALAGNELSWAYVFEWPFFGAFAVHLWWRLLREDDQAAARPRSPRVPAPAPAPDDDGPASDQPDPQLRAWREYLARLHAEHPPGGPPGAR